MINKSYGCISEYDFKIETICPKPNSLAVANLTTNSATINWAAVGFETAWTIKVSTTELTNPATDLADVVNGVVVSTTPTYSLSSLTPDANYYVYVKANCDSPWPTICSQQSPYVQFLQV